MNKLFKFSILAVFAVLGWCESSQAKLFDMQEFYLDNGLQVIVIPNYKAPIVMQMLWYKTGSVDEPLGKGGTAHLLEHLMFRGTDKIKGAEFNNIVNENGASSNAFTAQDYTSYYQFADVSRLELMMFMEADRMQNLKIDDNDFQKERNIVYEERKQVIENEPTSYFAETFQRNLWQEHPYSRPITGMPEEIMSLTKKDVEGFYQQFYAPNNAILILSGDINYETAQDLARKYYGEIPKREVGKKAEFAILNKNSSTKMEMKLPQVNATRFAKGYIVPSLSQDKPMAYALAVLSKYLGEGETSKLYQELVVEEKLAVDVSTSYDMNSRSYGSFSISALLAPEVSAKEFAKELNKALLKAMQELNELELKRTKQKMLSGIIYLKDNPSDAAMIVGALAASGMSVKDIEEYDNDINAVQLNEVKKAAELLFKSNNVEGVLSPVAGE